MQFIPHQHNLLQSHLFNRSLPFSPFTVAPAPVAVTPAPVATPAPAAPAPAAPASPAATVDNNNKRKLTITELEQFLIDFVVEQTGYPAEMVELDADLEADLGIDSIKKAQMFGEIAEQVILDVELEMSADMSLDDFPTLRSIIEFVSTPKAAGTAPAAPVAPAAVAPAPAPAAPAPMAPAPVAAPAPAPVAVAPVAPAPVAAPAPVMPRPVQAAAPVAPSPAPVVAHAAPQAAPSTNGATATSTVQKKRLTPAELEQFLIDFVVEQTGYPAEMVELDADLEADLGIDSIKKAQMFGEIAEQVELDVEIELSADMSLDDFPTLRSIIDFVQK
ncbi:MAG: phosphopantetheine-binding protein [Planctomycetaceae bacterium]